jgi:hypothetical protein
MERYKRKFEEDIFDKEKEILKFLQSIRIEHYPIQQKDQYAFVFLKKKYWEFEGFSAPGVNGAVYNLSNYRSGYLGPELTKLRKLIDKKSFEFVRKYDLNPFKSAPFWLGFSHNWPNVQEGILIVWERE